MLQTPNFAPPTTAVRKELTRQIRACDSFPALITVDAPLVDPIEWLAAQAFDAKLFWSNRGDQCIVAGAGEAARIQARAGEGPGDVVARCRELLDDHPLLKMYGGFSFDGQCAWPEFGAGRFWLPRFTLEGGQMHVVVISPADATAACQDVGCLDMHPSQLDARLPGASDRTDCPDPEGWTRNVNEALGLIDAEVLEKIVLARRATVSFTDTLDPIALTARLAASTQACYQFCFQIRHDFAFLGATPERLFKHLGDHLLSEVVAGTRPRGETVGQDQRLAYDLLTSDKDQLEHDIVRKSIRQKLHRLVSVLEVDSHASVLKLARKQHLYSEVDARLKPGVSDGELIERLHPTPAVGGYPTDNALPEIARLEPFNRGWYAAPIGWIGSDSAEFAVAIRSGLVRGRQLELYSGAGIVRGSTAKEEWQEIENKISDFVGIIRSEAELEESNSKAG